MAVARMAILVDAVYTATNTPRQRPCQDVETGRDMIIQAIHNAAAGHQRATAVVDGVWVRA